MLMMQWDLCYSSFISFLHMKRGENDISDICYHSYSIICMNVSTVSVTRVYLMIRFYQSSFGESYLALEITPDVFQQRFIMQYIVYISAYNNNMITGLRWNS